MPAHQKSLPRTQLIWPNYYGKWKVKLQKTLQTEGGILIYKSEINIQSESFYKQSCTYRIKSGKPASSASSIICSSWANYRAAGDALKLIKGSWIAGSKRRIQT
jgi:hypothetical protein